MTSLPADPVDLFAALFDLLDERPFGDGSVEKWQSDHALAARADEVEEQLVAEGAAEGRLYAGLATASDAGVFAVLRGIDAALDRLSPFTGSPGDAEKLAWVATRYAATGILSSAATEGAVLFRCAYPGRPVGIGSKADYYGLVRIPTDVWARVSFSRIPPALDLDISPKAQKENIVGVGCAPVLDSYSDLDIQATRRGLKLAYRLAPREAPVTPRIRPILETLENSGASIGVMPESVLSSAIKKKWLAELQNGAVNLDHLNWVLLGTGPDGVAEPPCNRAVLVHRSGATLIEQDKIHDFTLSAKQLRKWGLGTTLGTLISRVEDITLGTKVEIRESNLGRIAILICEDLIRGDLCDIVRGCGVSHLFVPIFSTEPPKSWAQFGSDRQVQEVGAWVVVATSLAVPRAVAPTAAEWATCLAIGPKDDRDEWESDLQQGTASAADDVPTLWIRGGRILRFDDF